MPIEDSSHKLKLDAGPSYDGHKIVLLRADRRAQADTQLVHCVTVDGRYVVDRHAHAVRECIASAACVCACQRKRIRHRKGPMHTGRQGSCS